MNIIEQSFLDRMDSDIRIKRITSENIDGYAEFIPKIARTNVIFGAVDKSGCPLGAVAALCEDGEIKVKALTVDKGSRRNKIGSMLICKIKDYAAENDINTITAMYLPCGDESHIIGAFFRSNGFVINDAEELTAYSICDIAFNERYISLSNTSPSDFNFNRLSELSASFIESLNALCRKNGEERLAPENAHGIIIDELSLVHISDGEIKAFVLITDLNGLLYISSIYTAPSAHDVIGRLIPIALKTIVKKYSSYKKLCIAAGNDELHRLVSCFTDTNERGNETLNSVRADYDISAGLEIFRSVKSTEAENVSEFYRDTEFFVPKIWRLTDILTDNGIECDMTIFEDGHPGIVITGKHSRVNIRYISAGGSSQHFVVLVYTYFELGGKSSDIQGLCERYNTSQSIITAVAHGDKGIMLRCTLTEGAVPIEESAFINFISIFSEQTTAFWHSIK